VIEGFNLRRRWYSIAFYSHFFIVRYLVLIFLILTPFSSSIALWILLANFQLCFLLLNYVKIYPETSNRVVSVMTESKNLMTISFCAVQTILDNQKPQTKYSRSLIFAYVYIAFVCIMILHNIFVAIKDIISYILNICGKLKKKKNQVQDSTINNNDSLSRDGDISPIKRQSFFPGNDDIIGAKKA
jgi:hypothetical protein